MLTFTFYFFGVCVCVCVWNSTSNRVFNLFNLSIYIDGRNTVQRAHAPPPTTRILGEVLEQKGRFQMQNSECVANPDFLPRGKFGAETIPRAKKNLLILVGFLVKPTFLV